MDDGIINVSSSTYCPARWIEADNVEVRVRLTPELTRLPTESLVSERPVRRFTADAGSPAEIDVPVGQACGSGGAVAGDPCDGD